MLSIKLARGASAWETRRHRYKPSLLKLISFVDPQARRLSADDTLSPVRLTHIHVTVGRHEDLVEEGLERLGDEGLKRVRGDRELEPDHLRDGGAEPGGGVEDGASLDVAARGPHACHGTAHDIDASHLGERVELDAQAACSARVAPDDRIVPDDAPGGGTAPPAPATAGGPSSPGPAPAP